MSCQGAGFTKRQQLEVEQDQQEGCIPDTWALFYPTSPTPPLSSCGSTHESITLNLPARVPLIRQRAPPGCSATNAPPPALLRPDDNTHVVDLAAVGAGAGDLNLAVPAAAAGEALDLAGGAAVAAALEDDVAGPARAGAAPAVAVAAAVALDRLGLEAATLVGVVAALGAGGHFGGWCGGLVGCWERGSKFVVVGSWRLVMRRLS